MREFCWYAEMEAEHGGDGLVDEAGAIAAIVQSPFLKARFCANRSVLSHKA